MKKYLLALFIQLCLLPYPVSGQNEINDNTVENDADVDMDTREKKTVWGRDSIKKDRKIPIGVFQWKIDERLGNVTPAEADTLPHHFQNFNRTDGYTGQYNFLGNLGSPRIARVFFDRHENDPLFFYTPYDYFYTRIDDFLFSNTKSPITNLSYHSCGTRENGEDRVRAYFATNINKRAGIGFKADYLYGRGYYNSQASSLFNGSLYGYYLGDRYNMHAWISANHIKQGENGGIESDVYITDPESISQSFTSKDIPTNLINTWNRNDDQTYFLTHRYNLGIERDVELPDSLRPVMPVDSILLKPLNDSIRTLLAADTLRRRIVLDSLRTKFRNENPIPQEFIPVTSFIHTLRVRHSRHTYYGYDTPEHFYTQLNYGTLNNTRDRSGAISVRNTLGIAMREGFSKWAKAGLTAFAWHEFNRYTLPDLDHGNKYEREYPENNVAVGGELSKTMGSLLHYNVTGEAVVAGTDVGQFSVDGRGDLNFRLFRDTMTVAARAYIKHLNPGFYFRHFHSQFAWWDNDLSKELKTRIEGTLSYRRTRTSLRVGVENITNYTYFGMTDTPYTLEDETTGVSRQVNVRQKSGSLQVFNATLKQDFKLGILHWDNELTYQATSDADALPLPALTLYSNLYIDFRIAKVLRVELGGDIRYFTEYDAPDYSPAIGQFAVQDASRRVKIGNYPICNVYANMHLKHCRLYVAVQHVNAGSGNAFLVPHYPLNPLNIHFGLSWNFFN